MDPALQLLPYYKRHILRLKEMLDDLDPSSNDHSKLVAIQMYIVERIADTERKIAKARTGRKQLKQKLRNDRRSKGSAKRLKAEISKTDNSLGGYKFLQFVWRCFGDGIAFKYASKWNLKRMLYEAGSPVEKRRPGSIGEKAGLQSEIDVLMAACSHHVPAVLCDITNTIRHGDVCLLGAADPFVIEVKSSKRLSKRAKRQISSINEIHSYFETDLAQFTDVGEMSRVEIELPEIHHNDAFNEVLDRALSGRNAVVQPERGLRYACFSTNTEPDLARLVSGFNQPLVFMLNESKTEMVWGNYYPFVLSIRSAEALYSFLTGKLFVLVAVDSGALKKLAAKIGYRLNYIGTELVAFALERIDQVDDSPSQLIVSEHFVGRIGHEFLSLEWVFRNEKLMIEKMSEIANAATGQEDR